MSSEHKPLSPGAETADASDRAAAEAAQMVEESARMVAAAKRWREAVATPGLTASRNAIAASRSLLRRSRLG